MNAKMWKNMDAGLLTMIAKVARNEKLSVTEEKSIADFLREHGRGAAEDGFPGGPAGDVRGTNSLTRTNWFNGRYLTAEALSRQDVYFDHRARLAAHALMPGIAWGLGLEADGANTVPPHSEARAGGLAPGRTLTLRRGLAYDHVGRPILVSTPFRFTIEQLLGTWRKTPQKVVGGGIDFMPCVCLAPDPGGATGGSAALPTGPYLLVIQAGETEEGGAKVMGELCAGAASANCRADAWRGGFGLSLVRFPVDLPLRKDLQSIWELRGTLSAYYFDVFEHALWKRWDPAFAAEGPFCSDTGPGRHDGAAIALAMLYLGEDGSVLFLDQWIPRRTICATPAEDWHRTRFGAPPRAAAWARIHQFQCMLAESLAQLPIGADGGSLYQRGFRHLPPIGFLPVQPRPAGDEFSVGFELADGLLSAFQGSRWIVSPLVKDAIGQAERYFQRTRVITYAVVALHDDDILEDLGNVFDKDPIQLSPRKVSANQFHAMDTTAQPAPAADGTPAAAPAAAPAAPAAPAEARFTQRSSFYRFGMTEAPNITLLPGYFGVLARVFEEMGLDDLVNRRTEIVKLVVPLQGLTRRHPLVGRLQEDALAQAEPWGVDPLLSAGNALGKLGQLGDQAEALAGLVSRLGLDMLPRHFVVYVKQRLVLLDALFYLLEVLQFLVEFLTEITSVAGSLSHRKSSAPTTEELHLRYMAQPAEKRAIVEAVLAQPDVQDGLVRAVDAGASGVAVSTRNQDFIAKVASAENALAASFPDPDERRRIAVGQVADAYAAEHADYQLVQALAAIQPTHTLAVVDRLAVARGAAVAAPPTVADELASDGPPMFADVDARRIYVDLRASLAERRVADYVPGSASALTVGEVLARPPAEAERLLGADDYARFREAYTADRADAIAGAQTLAEGVPATLAAKVEAGLQSGKEADVVIATLAAEAPASGSERKVIDETAKLLRITGGQAGFLKQIRRV